MITRGMNEPLLIVIDGCLGLIRAVNESFPNLRCPKVHKA